MSEYIPSQPHALPRAWLPRLYLKAPFSQGLGSPRAEEQVPMACLSMPISSISQRELREPYLILGSEP